MDLGGGVWKTSLDSDPPILLTGQTIPPKLQNV